MEISQLLATQGTTQKSSPLAQNAKSESGGGTRFAQLYQKAGQSAKPSSGTDSDTASAAALVSGGASSKELSGTNGDASLGKLLDKLDAGVELSNEEASMLASLTDNAQLTPEMTPLAQQIAALAGSTVQTQASALQGSAQVDQSGAALSKTSSATFGLDSIRQRLELIAQAQRGDATAQPTQAQQPATLLAAAQGEQALSPLDKLGDKGTSTRLADSGALRHQTLAAQGQASTLTQQNMMTTAEQSGTPGNVGATGSFIEAVAANAGGEGFNGRGSDMLAGQGVLTAGSGATGASSQIAGQTQGITQATLSAPLASAQWQQGLGQQLVSMHQRGNQRVELHLHPADLGPVSISLKMDDQLAQAQFSSANPHVRAAIEQAIPQLREALAENGIQLGEAMVGQHNQPRDGEQSSERGDALLAGSSSGPGAGDDSESLVMTPQNIVMDGRVNLYA
ncbi:flagellar hook-length control protein FliK [Halomonas sp. PR-M31]|uniref:flagellar hook-length control protein FliK n=1 Tax=Halomonas sp. PR-M31 TaxID=1471202 RepID=UPI00069E4460|nr:flagellar hook-length control protein FliK [Halomonas sp. PR-M31]